MRRRIQPTMLPSRETPSAIWIGCILTLIANLIVWGIAFWRILRSIGWFAYTPSADGGIALAIVFGIGLCQLVYVFPVLLILRNRDQRRALRGVTIGAILTAVLNLVGLLIVVVA